MYLHIFIHLHVNILDPYVGTCMHELLKTLEYSTSILMNTYKVIFIMITIKFYQRDSNISSACLYL